MSEVFQLCQTNFYNSIRAAQKHLTNTNPTETSLSQASQALTQASQELNRMEIQYNIDRQLHIKNKIDIFKDELRTYKKELTKHKNKLAEEAEQNSGPLIENEGEQNGVNPLIEAKRQMYENEAISSEVAVNMKKNNEALIKNINRMDDINNELTVAQKLLDSIKKKMRKNKLVMCGTIAFLVLIVCLIIYSYVSGDTKTTIIHDSPTKAK